MKRMHLTRKRREQIDGLLFVSLPCIGLFTFVGIPLFFSLFLSFGHLSSFSLTDLSFVGFENYARIFSGDKTFFKSIGWSFIFAVFSSLFQTVLSLLLAFLLNRPIRYRAAIRTILFIPYVCSAVAISYVWKLMLDGNFGLFNDFLIRLGLEKVNWLKDDRFSMLMMIIMSVWSGLGYGTILYSAALAGVDDSLYEAAGVAGANAWQKFLHITLPCISPTTFFLLVMGMIGNLQAFANFQIMAPIYSGAQIETMVYHVWWAAFEADFANYGMGYASALGWVSGAVIILFTFVMFKLQKYWVHYES